MRIAIVGPGAIGSTFAFQLSRAAHDVTVVARGARLAQLERDGAIVRTSGDRAAVTVASALEESVAYDLVIVSVLATQVAAVLPALAASKARAVMFMFNTFESLAPLRDAVGEGRFAFGFPQGVFTLLEEGRITPQIRRGTTASDARWARLFTDAAIPTVVEGDMQSWLRTHAALVAPLMSVGVRALASGPAISWREARAHTDAFLAGIRIVRAVGNDVRPSVIGAAARMPRAWLTALLWMFGRTTIGRDLGKLGSTEPRMLIDMMHAAAPELAAPLVLVRP